MGTPAPLALLGRLQLVLRQQRVHLLPVPLLQALKFLQVVEFLLLLRSSSLT